MSGLISNGPNLQGSLTPCINGRQYTAAFPKEERSHDSSDLPQKNLACTCEWSAATLGAHAADMLVLCDLLLPQESKAC